MLCESKSATYHLLTMRKSFYLDELRESVARPEGAMPSFGLPRWKTMPLESKIPMLPGPLQDAYQLTRRKLGQKLRVDFVDRKRFDTSDPYNRDVYLPYEGLHDPHLARFFAEAPTVRDAIIKTGFVTPELDVKCNLREYNAYRTYLRKMYGKFVRKELEHRDEMHKELMKLEFVEKMTVKKNERLKKDEIRDYLYKEVLLKREHKLQLMHMKQNQDEERVNALYQAKNRIVQIKKNESKTKREIFLEKRSLMDKREQQKILNTLKMWHERENRLRKTLKQNFLQKRNAEINNALERYDKKKKLQEESIERETFLKECAEKFKQSFIQMYNKKITESRKKLHELFLKKREALNNSHKPKRKIRRRKKICSCKKTK